MSRRGIYMTTHARNDLCGCLKKRRCTRNGVSGSRRRTRPLQIGEFLGKVYNRQRLHSALRYLTPEEFEQASQAKESDGVAWNGWKTTVGLPPLPQALEILLQAISNTPTAGRLLFNKMRMQSMLVQVSPINGTWRVSA